MDFLPPHCPFDACPSRSDGRFRFRRAGYYTRQCDRRVVPRFRCLVCLKGFSAQTFRVDYRLKRPELLPQVFDDLVAKVTHRQSARALRCRRETVERHFLRLAGHARDFHGLRLAEQLARGGLSGSYLLDELETYEHHRKLQPVTVPVLIERASGFVVAVETGALAPRKCSNERERRQLERIEEREKKKRVCESRESVSRCFERLRQLDRRASGIVIETDQKTSYASLVKKLFGERARHWRHSSRLPRTTSNPLWPINHTLARLRDGISRLVRETWAASKLRERLKYHLDVWVAYRNYVRGRTNREPLTPPAIKLGVCKQRWSVRELLTWRVFPALAPAM